MRGLKMEQFSFADGANIYNHMGILARPNHSYVSHTSTFLDLDIDLFLCFLHLNKLFMFNRTVFIYSI